jgi:hypothetical protein
VTADHSRRFSGPLEALAATERQPDLIISKADVSAWIHSDNLQVLATTDVLIDQADRAISPRLTLDEIDEFRRVFYRRCLRENPQDDWAPSHEAAAWELASRLAYLTGDPSGRRPRGHMAAVVGRRIHRR